VHACCGKAFVIADLGTISFPKVLDEIPIGSAQQITIYCHISQILMPYKISTSYSGNISSDAVDRLNISYLKFLEDSLYSDHCSFLSELFIK